MDKRTRAAALLMLALAGCARPCGLGPPVGRPTVSPCAEVEPVASPGALKPDLSELPAAPPAHPAWKSGPPRLYRPLEALQVQCCAAAADPLANALDVEARLAGPPGNCSTAKARAVAVTRQMLVCRSIEYRNRAASRALQAFYSLAETRAGRDLLEQTDAELRTMVGYIDELRAQGVQFDVDDGALRRRQLELQDRRIGVELALAELNLGLQQLVGLEINQTTPIWPAADLRVTDVPVDIEAAVAEGLLYRPDLALLRLLYVSLDVHVLEAVRAGLGQTDGALGTSAAAKCLLLPCRGLGGQQTEVQARRRQLARLLADQEAAAAAEIRVAARTVEARLTQIVLARRQVESLERHLANLTAKRGAPDGPTAFDLSEARLRIVEARRNVLSQVIAWRVAQVRLRQAQGMLAFECGYRLPAACHRKWGSPRVAAR